MSSMHECPECGENKSRDNFYPKKDVTKPINKYKQSCDDCVHMSTYGVTKTEYNEQMMKQKKVCIICSVKILKPQMKIDRNEDDIVQGIFCSQSCVDYVKEVRTPNFLNAVGYLHRTGAYAEEDIDVADLLKKLNIKA